MPTPPFGPALENALKTPIQGGKLSAAAGRLVSPRYFCCLSGTSVGVAKDPVAILVASPIRACMAQAVNADYSRSWSPSSTINNWEIDWGDGNTSLGAWPGAGSINHPLGGYAIPGVYTITLTVIDLLGATGEDTVEITIIDCDVFGLDAIASCELSGPWHTDDGAFTWRNVGGGLIDDVAIRVLRANPFTFGLPNQEWWAVTTAGTVYKTATSGASWQLITTLPIPDGEVAVPEAVSVLCSCVDRNEVHVLAADFVDTVWLYHTVDGGLTWTYVVIGGGIWSCGLQRQGIGGCGDLDRGNKFAPRTGEPQAAVGPNGGHVLHRSGTSWNNMGGWAGGQSIRGIGRTTSPSCVDTVTAQTGVGWSLGGCAGYGYYFSPRTYNDLGDGDNTWAARSDAKIIENIDCGNNTIWTTVDFAVYGLPLAGYPLHVYETTVLPPPGGNLQVLIGTNTSEILMYDVVNDVLTREDNVIQVEGGFGRLYLGPATYYDCAAVGDNRLRVRTATGTWQYDVAVCPGSIRCVTNICTYTVVATDGGIYMRNWVWPAGGYTKICSIGGAKRIWARYDTVPTTNVYGYVYTAAGIYKFTSSVFTSLVPPSEGLHHIMSMSADGSYVYLGLLDGVHRPTILRVAYDLSEVYQIYRNVGGDYGGVQADYSNVGKLWIFGDFGATVKVLVSYNFGANFTDVTDASWSSDEIVRPVLLNMYNRSDVVAILNDALEAWQTMDSGFAWKLNGVTPWAVHCGVRDFFEPSNLLIGRLAGGADHLQWSPNLGAWWGERSTGITANAPITSIEIVG